ncbi:MAG: autotransporter outer membrane beta-barrel domain-containing protein, partial [Planctomycetota bacterium]|nr:autotransporter outer membrane beta-barrel domain-containing protein [Planctomycetota bacterium]
DTESGYRQTIASGDFGFDHWVSPDAFLGFAGSFSHANYDATYSDIKTNGASVSVSGGAALEFGLESSVFAAFGYNRHRQERLVDSVKYRADTFNSRNWSLGIDNSLVIIEDDNSSTRLFANYDYQNIGVDGWNEAVSQGPMALAMGRQNLDLHRLWLGLGYDLNYSESTLISLQGYYAGYFGDRQGMAAGQLLGAPIGQRDFVNSSDPVARDHVGASVLLDYSINQNITLNAGYTFQMARKTRAMRGDLGLRVIF